MTRFFKNFWYEVLKSVKLGHMIQQSQSDMLTVLAGTSIKTIGLEVLDKIKTDLNVKDKAFVSSELRKYKDNTAGMILAFKINFLWVSHQLDYFRNSIATDNFDEDVKNLSPNNFYYKPNLTKSYFADVARSEISRIEDCQDTGDSPPRFDGLTDDRLLFIPKIIFTENAMGKAFFSVTDYSFSSARLRLCDQRDLVQNLIDN